MVILQTRLQEISRVPGKEVETLKKRCRKTDNESVNLLRRVRDAQEDVSRVPELE